MALKEIIKECIYLFNSLQDLKKKLKLKIINTNTPILLTDSQSALKLAENPEFHKKSKHIDIQYHFIRESIEEGKAKLAYINTKDQLADRFTKGLDNMKHNQFLINLRML